MIGQEFLGFSQWAVTAIAVEGGRECSAWFLGLIQSGKSD
jgi:hypothetical protein